MLLVPTAGENFQHNLLQISNIYCENDFLIQSMCVDTLLARYEKLMLARDGIDNKVDRIVYSLRSEHNGYRSLLTVTDKLVDVANVKAKNILVKVSNVSTVNKFLGFWTKTFETMAKILNMALDIYALNNGTTLFPAKPDCKSEEILKISRDLIDVDISSFYGDIQAFHLDGDCGHFTKLLHKLLIFYQEKTEFNLKVRITFSNIIKQIFFRVSKNFLPTFMP